MSGPLVTLALLRSGCADRDHRLLRGLGVDAARSPGALAYAKARGLNIEDTRLTRPRKLALLVALVALAIVWAGRVAADLLGVGSPKRKAHGYFAQSWFRRGFDRLRNLLA